MQSKLTISQGPPYVQPLMLPTEQNFGDPLPKHTGKIKSQRRKLRLSDSQEVIIGMCVESYCVLSMNPFKVIIHVFGNYDDDCLLRLTLKGRCGALVGYTDRFSDIPYVFIKMKYLKEGKNSVPLTVRLRGGNYQMGADNFVQIEAKVSSSDGILCVATSNKFRLVKGKLGVSLSQKN